MDFPLVRLLVAALSVAASAVLVVVLSPLIVWRFVVHIILWVLYRGKLTLAYPMDSVFLHLPAGRHVDIVAVLTLVGCWNDDRYDELQALFDRMNAEIPHFKFNAVPRTFLGYWCWDWRAETLDIRKFFKVPADLQWNKVYTKKDVEEYVGQHVFGRPYADGQPLWSATIFPKYLDEEHVCCVFRMHHSFADGVSLARFVERMFCQNDPRLNAPDPIERGVYGQRTTLMEIEATCLALPLVIITRLYGVLWKRRRLIHPTGEATVCSSSAFSTKRMQKVASQRGQRLSDLLACGTVHAVSRHCVLENSSHVEAPVKSMYVVHSLHGDRAGDTALVNKASLHSVALPVDGRIETEVKMEMTSDVMNRVRRLFHLTMAFGKGFKFFTSITPAWMFSLDTVVAESAMVISNIPGPRVRCAIGDLTCVDMYLVANGFDRTGIDTFIVSYADNVKLNVWIDSAFLKKGHTAEHVVDEFNMYMKDLLREV